MLLAAIALTAASASAMMIENKCPPDAPFVGCSEDVCATVRCKEGYVCEANACGECIARFGFRRSPLAAHRRRPHATRALSPHTH